LAAEPLGVGLTYQHELHGFLVENLDAIDYIELVPDTAWTDYGPNRAPRYVDDDAQLAWLRELRSRVPIVSHSIGMSIASAHRFRSEHVEQLAHLHELLDFVWHSDHLAYNLVLDEAGSEYLLGVPFSPTRDEETLQLLVPRIEAVLAEMPIPFLVENNVNYVDYGDEDFGQAEFLNELLGRTDCGLLLDLHNLFVDVRNGALADVADFIDRLDTSRVVEIHLAGGLEYGDFYVDAHSGAVPDEVWDLAADVVPRCPQLRGITFELLGSWFPHLGADRLRDTLRRMRALCQERVG
jgi:hypothetical protein